MKFIKKLHRCRFNDPICLSRPRLFGCICGKGGDSAPEVQKADPAAEARANVQAQLESIPKAAQLQYNVLTDPTYGLTPTTQAYENTRQSIYPEETKVRNQLVQNILNELMSPSGLTPEQQAAQTALREKGVSDLQESMRTRQNLGGTLYGGRSARAEAENVGNLQNQFVNQDIAREEARKLNNSQLALSILQMLYPNSGIQSPSYINPVVSADNQFSTVQNANNTQAQIQQQQNEAQMALQSALWQSLGNVAGEAAGSFFMPV
jgi:hypothetical protein